MAQAEAMRVADPLQLVAPHQVSLVRPIPFSLVTSDSRLRTGLSSSSSSHAVRSAKSELLWVKMAEQRALLTFSSLPQTVQRKLWNSMELNSMAVLLDLTSLSQTEAVAAAAVAASAVAVVASVAEVALEATEVASVAVVASAAVVALEATEVAVAASAVAEVASVAVVALVEEVDSTIP